MPLLEVNRIHKVTATIALEESTAKQVDLYAAFLKAGADDVVNQALAYVFVKDKDFQQFSASDRATDVPALLRIKKQARVVAAAKRGPKPRIVATQ